MTLQQKSAIRHVKNERLETIKKDYRGNKTINGQFANGDELYTPDFGNVLRWQLSRNPQRGEKKQDSFIPQVQEGRDFIASNEDMVVWLGHCSFFIRLAGITFLTDPVFYDLPMMPRRVGLPCPPEQLRNISFLLLSHAHRDHLDKKTIRTVFKSSPQLKALAPLRAGDILRSVNPHLPYQEAGWYQKFDLVPGEVEEY